MLNFNHLKKFSHKKFSRSSGHGGQNVNKCNTKVQLEINFRELVTHHILTPELAALLTKKHPHGFIEVTSQGTRFQHRNLEIAEKHLKKILTTELAERRSLLKN